MGKGAGVNRGAGQSDRWDSRERALEYGTANPGLAAPKIMIARSRVVLLRHTWARTHVHQALSGGLTQSS